MTLSIASSVTSWPYRQDVFSRVFGFRPSETRSGLETLSKSGLK